jgi:hypothetical protein
MYKDFPVPATSRLRVAEDVLLRCTGYGQACALLSVHKAQLPVNAGAGITKLIRINTSMIGHS